MRVDYLCIDTSLDRRGKNEAQYAREQRSSSLPGRNRRMSMIWTLRFNMDRAGVWKIRRHAIGRPYPRDWQWNISRAAHFLARWSKQ